MKKHKWVTTSKMINFTLSCTPPPPHPLGMEDKRSRDVEGNCTERKSTIISADDAHTGSLVISVVQHNTIHHALLIRPQATE
ncbi:hypothetical protein J6590_045703 [Homalodisca vitripennis]|nr:hypothetical protein J6590_045703 [Homalodisca vitripennis]